MVPIDQEMGDLVHEVRHEKMTAPAFGERIFGQIVVTGGRREVAGIVDGDGQHVLRPVPVQGDAILFVSFAAVEHSVVERLRHGKFDAFPDVRVDPAHRHVSA